MSSGAFDDTSAGAYQISNAHTLDHGSDVHGQSKHTEQFPSSSAAFQQQNGFHEQEAYQSGPQYLPDEAGYSLTGDAVHQEKHAESHEPIPYLNSEIQEHRSRLAATMLI